MKNILNKSLTALSSFVICLFLFLSVMFLSDFPIKHKEKTVAKNQPDIAYSAAQNNIDTNILIDIDACPVQFLAKISSKSKKVSVSCKPKATKKEQGLAVFDKTDYQKQINLTLLEFESIVNFLGGVEVETPYGLPSPANAEIIITKNERLLAHGASLGALLCKEKEPSAEKMAYYSYILSEICLKFLKNCDTEYYKFLNDNSETDISYTEYYDSFKALNQSIKHTDFSAPNGYWKNGEFCLTQQ